MKSTGHLTAVGAIDLANDVIIIHPNDGYDLGLISFSNPLRILMGGSDEELLSKACEGDSGTLLLKNDCTLATVRMSLSRWKKLGRPQRVRLACHEDRLLVSLA
jgi:hypothetical protein